MKSRRVRITIVTFLSTLAVLACARVAHHHWRIDVELTRLASDDEDEMRRAVEWLVAHGRREAAAPVLELILEDHERAEWGCAALYRLGRASVSSLLLAVYDVDELHLPLHWAVEEAWESKALDAEEPVSVPRLLDHPRANVRAAATLLTISRGVTGPELVERTRAGLRDEALAVRFAVVKGLSRRRDWSDSVREAIREALSNDNDTVRSACVDWLGPRATAPAVLEGLQEKGS